MSTPAEIDGGEDTLDSRHIESRIDYLERELEIADEEIDYLDDNERVDIVEELEQLRSLRDQVQGYTDWHGSATIIADDSFEDYARQIGEEMIDQDGEWPSTYIDWSAAADALKTDYTSATAFGHDWWVR